MQKEMIFSQLLIPGLVLCCTFLSMRTSAQDNTPFRPLDFEQAGRMADSVLIQMTLDEKIALIGGDRSFFIRGLPRLQIDEVYMADATQGIHIRQQFRDVDLSDYQPEKSTAFPCPILLAATWNPDLCYTYAEAIGEECRAAGVGILLGPGLNQYRHSQCGRNFEYFGEDPNLRSQMIASYVQGLQSTGTVATLKHFFANNTDFYRRKSNSIIDERALNEIYLPPFKAGIDAGARAVMTAYNLFNGEWCGQSEVVINEILRKQLGFNWLVMTDWSSVYDGEKLARSGQDLEMPMSVALRDAPQLIRDGKVKVEDINRMVESILRVYFDMNLKSRKKNPQLQVDFDHHESIALQTAREGMVLLKNEFNILPLKKTKTSILLTGNYIEEPARGGGAADVAGFNYRSMLDELKLEFGERIQYVKNPNREEIRSAGIVLCNVGTSDSEGWDRPFELSPDQEDRVLECVQNNPRTVVIVTSGSGVRMTGWNEKAAAILYAWYGGQTGNRALAEIIAGKTNPSGKLPITIERDFKDSPGYGYLPGNEQLYSGWHGEEEKAHPVYDLPYREGIFSGYRWYEHKKIDPLYPFGHGLSYSEFKYSGLSISKETFGREDTLLVSFTVKNTGTIRGAETAQLYIQDTKCSVPRPVKELKGFQKVELDPGQSVSVALKLKWQDFAFWNPEMKGWYAENGKFVLHVGSSSADIRLQKEIELF
jgi:beta-glucosidase